MSTMSTEVEVSQQDLHSLFNIFKKKAFLAGPSSEDSLNCKIVQKCESLFKLDYSLIEIDNTNGCLSPSYPGRIFIPETEHGHRSHSSAASHTSTGGTVGGLSKKGSISTTSPTSASTPVTSSVTLTESNGSIPSMNGFQDFKSCNSSSNDLQLSFVSFSNQFHPQQVEQQQLKQSPSSQQSSQQPAQHRQHTIYENQYDMNKIRDIISTMAKYARCRQRFVVPVIMFRGKYICRSATTSISQEVYGRKAYECAIDYLNIGASTTDEENNEHSTDDLTDEPMDEHPLAPQSRNFSHEEVIRSDLQLLNELNVTTIVDLMVEKRKIKFFMAVSSSEKSDPEHYSNFNILSLPYPGCEFFKQFRDNNYMARNLHYDWKRSVNDAHISVPMRGPAAEMDIPWYDYKKWDLVEITQNYLKAILKCTQEESSGLLIHCISGWDRTPLFVSLLRLSLWADGLIHQTLTAMQMTYFTVAYDWYLFGHQLPDRLSRCEDIMFFCFHVLKHIAEEDFRLVEHRKRTKTSSSSGSSITVLKSSDSGDDEPDKGENPLNFDLETKDSYTNSNIFISCRKRTTTSSSSGSSSITILKSSDSGDDEPDREENLLNFNQDSNDSNSNSNSCTSNSNSICDISITDNFATTNITRRSPNPKRTRTSPISVPGTGVNSTRQRLDSNCSIDGWQLVNVCGSIESNTNVARSVTPSNGCEIMCPSSCVGGGGSSNNVAMDCSVSNGSTNIATTKDTTTRIPPTLRKQRLNSVRAIFIQAYSQTVGLKFQEGSSMNLARLIGTLF